MDEYISREAVINITAETGAWETQNRVRELPAADVQPVKHGKCITREQFAEAVKQLVNEFTANDGYGTSASATFLALCFGNLELRLFGMGGDSE